MIKSRWRKTYDHKVELLQAVVLKENGKRFFEKTEGGVWNIAFLGTPKSIRVDIVKPGFTVICPKGMRKFRRMTDALNYFKAI